MLKHKRHAFGMDMQHLLQLAGSMPGGTAALAFLLQSHGGGLQGGGDEDDEEDDDDEYMDDDEDDWGEEEGEWVEDSEGGEEEGHYEESDDDTEEEEEEMVIVEEVGMVLRTIFLQYFNLLPMYRWREAMTTTKVKTVARKEVRRERRLVQKFCSWVPRLVMTLMDRMAFTVAWK